MWIEPVRDWNIFTVKKFKENEIECELNLWGIETIDGLKQLSLRKLCELNLWGIETTQIEKSQRLKLGVNWTCEGLKLELVHRQNFVKNLPCELNLWGIETCLEF